MPVSHGLKLSILLSEMLQSDFFTTYYEQQTVPWLISLLFFTNRGIIRQLPKALGPLSRKKLPLLVHRGVVPTAKGRAFSFKYKMIFVDFKI